MESPGKNLFKHTFNRNLNQSLTQMKIHFKRCSCEVWRDNQGRNLKSWSKQGEKIALELYVL